MTMKKIKIYEVGYKTHPTEEQLQKIKDADNGFDSVMQLIELNERVLVFASSRESAKKQFTSDSDDENYNIDYWTIDYIVEHGYAHEFPPLEQCNEEWADYRVLGDAPKTFKTYEITTKFYPVERTFQIKAEGQNEAIDKVIDMNVQEEMMDELVDCELTFGIKEVA